MTSDFKEILRSAKLGDSKAQEWLVKMYAPMLQRLSILNRTYDEDLYQEVSYCLLDSIAKFQKLCKSFLRVL